MLLLCACGKKSEVWETDGAGLVQMETPEDGEKIVGKAGKLRQTVKKSRRTAEHLRKYPKEIRKA